jgi:hypothetical protein
MSWQENAKDIATGLGIAAFDLALLYFVGRWLYKFFKEGYKPNAVEQVPDHDNLICTTCGETGKAVYQPKGSGAIELLLYICIVSVPVALLYSIWRRSNRQIICGSCKGQVIPLSSPMGRKLAKGN